MISRLAISFGRRPLSHQLAVLVAVTAIPLLISSLLMFNRLVANQREVLRESLLVGARTLAALVDDEIETHAAIASTLAASKNLKTGDLVAFREEALQALQFIPGAWLALTTPDGQMILNTLVPEGAPLPRHVAPDIVARGFDEHRFQVADLTMGPASHKLVTYIEMPSFKDGSPQYSLAIAVSPDRFRNLIAKQFTHGEVVGILDRTNRFVARIPDPGDKVGALASTGWQAAIARSPTGWTENKTLEGEQGLTGYTTTAHGWTVGIAQLEDAIGAPQRRILAIAAWGFGALTLSSLIFGFGLAHRFVQAITQLAETARRIGDGQSVPVPVTAFAEAEHIARALSDASAELKRRGQAIDRHSQELERRVAERTQDLEHEIARRSETEVQLRQSQKMESLGQLTGGIAHDFNNMLAIIIGNLEMIQRRIGRGSIDVLPLVDNALDGARRSASLTHRLLAFSRQQPLMPTIVDVNSLLETMAELLRRTLGEQVILESIKGGGLWRVGIDIGELEHSLVNLAVNARDAMPTGGRLTLETFNASLDDDYCQSYPGLSAGQYVGIAVSDTGCGMDAATVDRAFDPFFTTKDVGKGTGLGLSQVFGFVKQSGGHIKIYSEVGHGTTVKMYLPRFHGVDAAVSRTADLAKDVTRPVSRRREVIVVVEDEDKLRRMVVDTLRELGYTVAHARKGADALHVIEKIQSIDLLFTDVVMPDMNGRQLADKVTGQRPDIRVLYTTGYTRNAIIHGGTLDPGVNLLPKPFTTSQLANKVRHVLDQP